MKSHVIRSDVLCEKVDESKNHIIRAWLVPYIYLLPVDREHILFTSRMGNRSIVIHLRSKPDQIYPSYSRTFK